MVSEIGQKPSETATRSPWALCVAPMMDWTDRHCRFFHRLLAPHARLYTEMVTTGAVLHGDREHLLGFDPAEHPLALQLGGHEPHALAESARIAEVCGYDEVNLNVGCPSDRVQNGRFGACLMREPELVADCVTAMREAVDIPVTVKCRIGVDDQDEYADLQNFVTRQVAAGVQVLMVHARKAWLQGLSPKENREIPPLDYPRVYRLKQEFPQLTVIINGGIIDVESVIAHLHHVDGVMLGRAAYHDPYLLACIEHRLYAEPLPEREAVLAELRSYVDVHLARGGALHHIGRHLLGLFHGEPGARRFRRYLSQNMHRPGVGYEVFERALQSMQSPARAA